VFVYLEKYVVPIGHGFSFFGLGKVMENTFPIGKEWSPCVEVKVFM